MKRLVCEKCGYVAEDESVDGVMDAMWRHVSDEHFASMVESEGGKGK